MPRFRKKPVEIEAVQFDGDNYAEIAEFAATGWFRLHDVIQVQTREGTMTAMPDDWIIRGVKGELYPCKPDIFDVTYERVS